MTGTTVTRAPASGSAVQKKARKAPFPVEFWRSDLGKKYEVTLLPEDKVNGAAAHVLDLKPRTGGGLFSAIRLWVDKAREIPVQTRLTEPTGDHTTIRFDDVVVNQALPSGAFDLKLPKDVVEVR